MADEGTWKGCACDCPVCERASWQLSVIVIAVYGDSEPWGPRLGSSFQERRVPGFLGSIMRKRYRSLSQGHYSPLALGFLKESSCFSGRGRINVFPRFYDFDTNF